MVDDGEYHDYPLENVYITIKQSHMFMRKLTISLAMFNSYVELPEGNILYRCVLLFYSSGAYCTVTVYLYLEISRGFLDPLLVTTRIANNG